MYAALHKRLLRRWWRRLLLGQPSVALEVHHASRRCDSRRHATPRWLAVSCRRGSSAMVEAALRRAYPNCRLGDCRAGGRCAARRAAPEEARRRSSGASRCSTASSSEREPPMNRLLTVMGACDEPAFVQLAMTPDAGALRARAPSTSTSAARARCRARAESTCPARSLAGRGRRAARRPRASSTGRCSSSICASSPRRAPRASGSPPSCAPTAPRTGSSNAARRCATACSGSTRAAAARRGKSAARRSARACSRSTELAAVWQLPSVDYLTVPFARCAVPLAPAPPAIWRPPEGRARCATRSGRSRSILQLRKQNTAVPGTVEQGKSSYPRCDRRRGPAPRALRGDRARPEGRRGRGGAERRARRAHLHAAGLRPPDVRLQPARGRCPGRRDRRLRRRRR